MSLAHIDAPPLRRARPPGRAQVRDSRRAQAGALDLRAQHAALVTPMTAGFEQAACALIALCEDDAASSLPALLLAGAGFAAGMPLPELARRTDTAMRATGAAACCELAARARLFDTLLHGDTCAAPPAAGDGFGHWLARLMSSWYAGDGAQARHAASMGERLLCGSTPAADLLCHHLFAALALAQDADADAARPLAQHCSALRRLAGRIPEAAGFVLLADAARARHGGDALAALRGFENAAAEACRRERHWLAALAWEAAASQAGAAGLASTVSHYRRAALASYGCWGALGRIATLRRRWEDEAGPLDAPGPRTLRQHGIGELGLSIAHEVNQPLAAIALHAAAARKWLHRPQPDIARALSSLALIGDAGRHAGDIVRSMQRLASQAGNELGEVAVDRCIAEVLLLLRQRLRKEGIRVELALGLGERVILANRTQFQQVLTNLVVNAIEALTGAGAPAGARRIVVESRAAGAGAVEIAVRDNGPGIAPHNRDRVFGSLFSTKPHSSGMGLAISLAIVRAHGGQLGYEPAVPQGACFRLRLAERPPLDGG